MRRPREGKNVEQKQSVRALLQRDAPLTKKAQLRALIQLSLPAIFAQLTSIMMQYIDAAMVGALGAEASAAIGVVSTSTWLLSGLCTAAASGFSVQVAQRIGAADEQGARSVVKHGLLITLLFALALSFVFFRGLNGLGLGTVVSALIVGRFVNLFNSRLPLIARIASLAKTPSAAQMPEQQMPSGQQAG